MIGRVGVASMGAAAAAKPAAHPTAFRVGCSVTVARAAGG